jgi:hypothetical protein
MNALTVASKWITSCSELEQEEEVLLVENQFAKTGNSPFFELRRYSSQSLNPILESILNAVRHMTRKGSLQTERRTLLAESDPDQSWKVACV